MNGIQGIKTDGLKLIILLDAVVTIMRYKKITIDHSIYIKVFYDGNVPYPTVSVDDVFKNTNNMTAFPELARVFEEHYEMKVQEGYFFK